MAVLIHDLLLHAERCMLHEDVVENILQPCSNHTLDEWVSDSCAERIEEMDC